MMGRISAFPVKSQEIVITLTGIFFLVIGMLKLAWPEFVIYLTTILSIYLLYRSFLTVPPHDLIDKVLSPFGMFISSLALVIYTRLIFHIFYFRDGYGFLEGLISHDKFIVGSMLTLMSLLVAFIFFWIGSMAGWKLIIFNNYKYVSVAIKDRNMILWILFLIIIGVMGWVKYVYDAGEEVRLIILQPTLRDIFGAGHGYLKLVIQMLPAALILLYWRYLCIKKHRPFVIAAFTIFVLFTMLIFGQRSNLVFPLVSMMALRHFLYKRFHLKKLLLYIFLLCLLMAVFVTYRSITTKISSISSGTTIAENVIVGIGNSNPEIFNKLTKAFLPLDSYMLTLLDPPEIMFGETYLYVFLQAIPSFTWDDKKGAYISVGKMVTNSLQQDINAGVPNTVIGELYVNYRWPGIIFGMFILGVIFGKAQRWFVNNKFDNFAILAVAILAPDIFMLAWGSATIWFKLFIKDGIVLLVTRLFIKRVRAE